MRPFLLLWFSSGVGKEIFLGIHHWKKFFQFPRLWEVGILHKGASLSIRGSSDIIAEL